MDQPTQELHLCRDASARPTSKAPLVRAEGSSHAIGMSPYESSATSGLQDECDRERHGPPARPAGAKGKQRPSRQPPAQPLSTGSP